MARGRVLQFDQVRGYGFVAANDGGEDVFLHASVFDGNLDDLAPGRQVEFQVMAGDRGRKAFAVHLVTSESDPGEPTPAQPTRPTASGLSSQHEPESQAQPAENDEQLCDVLLADEFGQELTELLLNSTPTLTGEQILQVRHSVLEVAAKHGWLDA